jgi:RHS repeat-associated protein
MNVTALVDTDGDVVERYVYDAYGQATVLHGADDADGAVTEWEEDTGGSDWDNRVLYAGYRFDAETGLYHVRHRSYHPALGRWVQRDPAEYVDGMGLYEYVGSSPIAGTDPTGLQMGGWGNWGVDVPPRPPEYDIAGKIGLTYIARFPRGYVGNLIAGEVLGDWDIDDLVVRSIDLSTNREIRSRVDSVMTEHAKKLCSKGPDDFEYLSYSDSLEFSDFPLSGILGTGQISANGSGSVWEQSDCESCAYVYVKAQWSYTDEIDMLDFFELYDRGYIYLPPEPLYNPLAALGNLGSLAEGLADLYIDKIMDANYPFFVSWEETMEGCCDYFE